MSNDSTELFHLFASKLTNKKNVDSMSKVVTHFFKDSSDLSQLSKCLDSKVNLKTTPTDFNEDIHNFIQLNFEHELAYNLIVLYNKVCLRKMEMELTNSNGDNNCSYTVRFPASLFVLLATNELKSALAALDDRLLTQLDQCFMDESGFCRWMDNKDGVCDKGSTVLTRLLAKEVGSGVCPESREEMEALFTEHDIYDKYICEREWRLFNLRRQLLNIPKEADLALRVGLAHFDKCMFKGFSLRLSDLTEVKWNPHYRKACELIKEWMPTVFDQKTVKVFSHDVDMFELVACAYPDVDNLTIIFETMKFTLYLWDIDERLERNPEYLEFVLPVLKETSGSSDLKDEFKKFDMLVSFLENMRVLNKALNGDIIVSTVEWIQGTRDMRETKLVSLDHYYENRFLDIAIFAYLQILTLYHGHGNYQDIPKHILDPILVHIVLENDLYSYGKETVEAGKKGYVNIIKTYRELFPEMSMQEIIFDLEKKKSKATEQLLDMRGTEWEYMYLMCLGNAYFSINTKRYLVMIHKSKNSCIVRYI